MTYHPFMAGREVRPQTRTEGLITCMIRLWIEHHQRMIDLGIRPH